MWNINYIFINSLFPNQVDSVTISFQIQALHIVFTYCESAIATQSYIKNVNV